MDAAGPQPRHSLFATLLTYRGRSHRSRYWLTVLFLSVVYTAILGATLALFSQSQAFLDIHPVGISIIYANYLVFGVLVALNAIRRLHDRGKSGHWLWVLGFVPLALGVAATLLERPENPIPALVLTIISAAFSIWSVVEIGFLRGTPGPNAYGPDPLAGK